MAHLPHLFIHSPLQPVVKSKKKKVPFTRFLLCPTKEACKQKHPNEKLPPQYDWLWVSEVSTGVGKEMGNKDRQKESGKEGRCSGEKFKCWSEEYTNIMVHEFIENIEF